MLLSSFAFLCWNLKRVNSNAVGRGTLHTDSLWTLYMTTPSGPPEVPVGLASSADLEAFSLWFKDVPFALSEVWSAPAEVDIHPPLYFLIVHFFRAIGFEFQGAFMAANAIGFGLLALAVIWLGYLDQRSTASSLALQGLILGTPALLAASEEARHWVFFSGGSLVFSVCFSKILLRTMNGAMPSKSLRFFVVLLSAFCLLIETSFVLLLLSWIVVTIGVGIRSGRVRIVITGRLQEVAGSIILWLAFFPAALANFKKGTDLNQVDTGSALLIPRYNSEISFWFVRRMGDLWQIGGDTRVTFVLATSSLGFLIYSQTIRSGRFLSRKRRQTEPPKVSHGFLIGLAGTSYFLLYFLLYSFEYMPLFAVGFKYILPFGVLLLLGLWDALQQSFVGKYITILAAVIMVYHSLVFASITTGQSRVIDRMASADTLVIVGNHSDLHSFAYSVSLGRLPRDVRLHLLPTSKLNSSRWESLCPPGGEEAERYVFVDRPPWGPGAAGLFSSVTDTEIRRVLGPVEFGEVAQVCVNL